MKEINIKSYPITVLLHLLAFVTFGYSLFWSFNNKDVPTKNPNGQYGGRLKYLTYWDLVCIHIYLLVINNSFHL
jgi:hypothetical protein